MGRRGGTRWRIPPPTRYGPFVAVIVRRRHIEYGPKRRLASSAGGVDNDWRCHDEAISTRCLQPAPRVEGGSSLPEDVRYTDDQEVRRLSGDRLRHLASAGPLHRSDLRGRRVRAPFRVAESRRPDSPGRRPWVCVSTRGHPSLGPRPPFLTKTGVRPSGRSWGIGGCRQSPPHHAASELANETTSLWVRTTRPATVAEGTSVGVGGQGDVCPIVLCPEPQLRLTRPGSGPRASVPPGIRATGRRRTRYRWISGHLAAGPREPDGRYEGPPLRSS